jgi:uncharacterized membrane protein YhfC
MKFTLLSQVFAGISVLVALAAPIATALYFHRREKISWKVIGVGALTWFLFTQVLEGMLHLYVLQHTTIPKIPWAFVLYGILAAGIFEEVGRYVMMRYMLPLHRAWKDGVAFGIGHGGIESLLIGVLGGVQVFILGMLLNAGQLESIKIPASALQSLTTVLTAPSWVFLLMGLERVFAFIFQIAMSVLVMYALRYGKIIFVLYAVVLHAFFDLMPAMYQAHIAPLWLTEIFVAVFALIALYSMRDSKKYFLEEPHQ